MGLYTDGNGVMDLMHLESDICMVFGVILLLGMEKSWREF